MCGIGGGVVSFLAPPTTLCINKWPWKHFILHHQATIWRTASSRSVDLLALLTVTMETAHCPARLCLLRRDRFKCLNWLLSAWICCCVSTADGEHTEAILPPPNRPETPSHSSTPHKKSPVSPPRWLKWANQAFLLHVSSAEAKANGSGATQIPVAPANPPPAGSTVPPSTLSFAVCLRIGFTYVGPWKSWSSRSSVSAVLTVRTLEGQVLTRTI